MNGLPDDFDAGIFVGKTIERICIREVSAEVTFDDQTAITAFGQVTLNGVTIWVDRTGPDRRPSDLFPFLGQTIRSARVEDQSTLALTFDGSAVLRFVEDTDMYECYHLNLPDRRIIV